MGKAMTSRELTQDEKTKKKGRNIAKIKKPTEP